MANTLDFHRTTTKELLAIKDRVRLLVNHWGEDGRSKEIVLKTVIKRFLPKKFSIASGFVVRQTEVRGEHLTSSQIDLMILDDEYPVLFQEGDFVIATPDAIRGIIEVKTNLKNQSAINVIKKANKLGKFICEGRQNNLSKFYNGIFSFEGFEQVDPLRLKTVIRAADVDFMGDELFKVFKVNHISFNKDYFYKYWNEELHNFPDRDFLYRMEDLSFSFFIGNLIDMLGTSVIQNSNIWFPTDKSIETILTF